MKKSSGGFALRLLLVTLVLLLVGFASLLRFAFDTAADGPELSINEVLSLAERGAIRSASLLDEDAVVVGQRCLVSQQRPVPPPVAQGAPGATNPLATPPLTPCSGTTAAFQASYPRSDVATSQLIEALSRGGADVVVDKQTSTAMAKLIATFVFPLLLLANLFGLIFASKGGDSSISEVAGFGRINRRRQRKKHLDTTVTFDDVAGSEEPVTELKEVIDYLTDPARFEAFGAAPPKGVLLFGPPGCGKTLLARAAAGESGVPFFSVSGAEFVESLVGVGAARVRDLFRQVREVAPAIVFIDEIDAVGRKRGGEGSTGGEREQTVNQLLVEMDGFEVSAGIVVMGATNRPDILDPALMRPGRFDRHITLEPPDIHGREAILRLHAAKRPIAPDVDFTFLARRTPGFTGADLSNVINEAALLALRSGSGGQIDADHLSEAVLRVVHGPQRRGKLMNPTERSRIAYHEAGHALVASAVGRRGDIQRVSVVARGKGLGQSVVSPDSERVLLTVSEMADSLAVTMGGVAAEVMVFGESSTTARHDVESATSIARDMVGVYGMSPRLGRLHMVSHEEGFLDSGSTTEVLAPATLKEFDDEVRQLLVLAELRATQIVTHHRKNLERMVAALEAEETLEGPALESVLAPIGPESTPPPEPDGAGTGPGRQQMARNRS